MQLNSNYYALIHVIELYSFDYLFISCFISGCHSFVFYLVRRPSIAFLYYFVPLYCEEAKVGRYTVYSHDRGICQ